MLSPAAQTSWTLMTPVRSAGLGSAGSACHAPSRSRRTFPRLLAMMVWSVRCQIAVRESRNGSGLSQHHPCASHGATSGGGSGARATPVAAGIEQETRRPLPASAPAARDRRQQRGGGELHHQFGPASPRGID